MRRTITPRDASYFPAVADEAAAWCQLYGINLNDVFQISYDDTSVTFGIYETTDDGELVSVGGEPVPRFVTFERTDNAR